MAASDHLSGDQFRVLYHGTTAEDAESIRAHGYHPGEGHIYPAQWPTLTENRQTGEAYSHGDHPAVVEMHVPHSDFWETSRSSGKLWPAQDHMGGNAYAVKDALPPEYVAGVHPVKERPPYPD